MLQCSEWWVKEQARKRRIPFSLIGGSYRFTDEHVAEVIRLFEQRPEPDGVGTAIPAGSGRRRAPATREASAPLRARVPRRSLKSMQIAS